MNDDGDRHPDDLFGDGLPHVTVEAVQGTMVGFELSLAPNRDWEWLTHAVRRSISVIDRQASASNADVRRELQKLSSLAGETWAKLFAQSGDADDWLWRFALRRSIEHEAAGAPDGALIGDPEDYRVFKAAVHDLDWLAGFLRDAARAVPDQEKKWRSTEQRERRVQRGQALAPVFVSAFGRPITTNNWPSGKEPNKSPFMDFYQRIVSIAFGEHATPDISGVLKEAHRRHNRDPFRLDIA